MSPQPLLFVAAVACLLATTQAIKCYSCIYADDFEGPIPPGFVNDPPAQDPRCGKILGEGITAGTYPNSSNYQFVGFDVPRTRNSTTEELNKIQQLSKLLQAPKSTETKSGPPFKVYCANISGDFDLGGTVGTVGYITARLLVASDDLIVRDGCIENEGMTVCTCSEDECNGLAESTCSEDECDSASGINLSLAVIAATLISKFIFEKLLC